MKRPLIYSICLHAVILILLMVGFYNPFKRKIAPTEQPMMIEFVQIAEESAAPQLAPEAIQNAEPQPTPPKPTPPKPEPKPEPEPVKPEPEPVKPEPIPEPEPIKPEPEPQKPEPEPEPKPIPEPVPVEKPKEKPKKEKEKPKEQPQRKQKAEITLEKKKPKPKKTDEKTKKKKPEKSFDDFLSDVLNEDDSTPSKGKGAPAKNIGAVVTASEIDAIRQRIYKCWIIPAGIRGARDMVVDIHIHTARDGTVTRADIDDKARMRQDPAFRSAAESARRAVLDPRCNPLPIPPEKYEQFKDFIFGFNPKDMF